VGHCRSAPPISHEIYEIFKVVEICCTTKLWRVGQCHVAPPISTILRQLVEENVTQNVTRARTATSADGFARPFARKAQGTVESAPAKIART
jgi:hypothetical protein